MKIYAIFFLSLFLMLSCMPSVQPLFNEQDLETNDQFLGLWSTTDFSEQWEVREEGKNSYLLYCLDDSSPMVLKGHLLKIAGEWFLDIFPSEEQIGTAGLLFLPMHSFYKVEIGELNLKVFAPDETQWRLYMQQAKGRGLAHTFLPEGQLLLTASPAELQKFIRKYPTKELFSDSTNFIRLVN
ncbi:hypothetical protein [Persicobacter diffluens]